MTVVVLVRHGESESNILQILDDNPDSAYHLTETGRAQISYTANQLSNIKFDGIISSPILRTRETAEIIANRLNLSYSVDNRLVESGQGLFSGRNFNQLLPLPRGNSSQETWGHIIERFSSLFSELKGKYVLVSHALPIKATVANYLGLPDESSTFGVDIKLASMSAIDVDRKRVLCVGSLLLSEEVRNRIENSEK